MLRGTGLIFHKPPPVFTPTNPILCLLKSWHPHSESGTEARELEVMGYLVGEDAQAPWVLTCGWEAGSESQAAAGCALLPEKDTQSWCEEAKEILRK